MQPYNEQKPPPHNTELEMAIIGDFIEYPEKRDEIMLNIRKDYFYKTENQQLYQAILKVYSENPKFDLTTLSNPETKGFAYQYVKCLDSSAGSSLHVSGHIKELIEIVNRRDLFFLGMKIVDTCDKFPSIKTKQAIELQINKITDGKFEIKKISEIVEQNNDEAGFNRLTTTILKSGNEYWDKMVITKTGQFNLIAGRPSQGKTAFMLHLAKANSICGHRVGIISLEMPETSLATRMAMSEGGSYGTEFDKYLVGCNKIYNLPIYINDNENYKLEQIANIANAMIVRHNCDVLYIDYLQLIKEDSQTLYQQVTNLSKGLKHLAKKTTKPIYCLAQLSRSTETRANHRPMLSDLRDSGYIEQDADIVIFIYRPCKYEDIILTYKTKPDKSEFKDVENLDNYFETIIGKQREGEVGIYKWYYDPKRNFFAPLENKLEVIQENIF